MSNNALTENERVKLISELTPTGEKKAVSYAGKNEIHDVFEIPLEFLLYNPYNGRIRSLTKSYESQYADLNPQEESDKIVIEQFLYDSAKGKNDKTIESIKHNGQQEFGIITKDGVIIDGNRRAMILNLLNSQDHQNRKFKAVILPDKLLDKRKDIISLETNYQMGVDNKVDYNPIEKYIRCKELNEYYSIDEIAGQMAESPKTIQEWFDILALMEEYLEYLGTPKTYIRLEKREGHFVDLFKYLKSYKNATNNQSVDWAFTKEDVEELKAVYFDYIRLRIPVSHARIIARPSASNSFFCYNEIWREFIIDHKTTIAKNPQPSFRSFKDELPDDSYSTLILKIDTIWKQAVSSSMEETLFHYEQILGDIKNNLAPLRLLKRAKSTLFQINHSTLKSEMDDEKAKLINDLDSIIKTFKSFI